MSRKLIDFIKAGHKYKSKKRVNGKWYYDYGNGFTNVKKKQRPNIRILEDVNVGEEINNIFDKWQKIKTQKQYDKFKIKYQDIKFGTYKNKDIKTIVEEFSSKDSNINKIVKKQFLVEMNIMQRDR